MTQTVRLEGVEVQVDGEGEETLVMLHGWPDTWRLWDDQVAALKSRYRCVRFSLPGFEPGQPRRAASLDEIVALLRRVIEHVSPGRPVTLMLHDWGCLFGYQFVIRHPALVARVIGVDVGDAGSGAHVRALPARAKAMVLAYQGWLAIAWGVGRFSAGLATRMTRWMARALGCRTDQALVHGGMNYPYYITWSGRHGGYRGLPVFAPPCPMLFVYGLRKPFMFHSESWARRVAAQPGSQVLPLETGHWVMRQQPERFNAAVLAWLQGSA